jgi:cytochrome P450
MPAILQAAQLAIGSPHRFIEQCAKRYGSFFTLRIPGIPPQVFVSDPSAIREIFTVDGEKVFAANIPLDTILGENSLLILHGPRHARDRRLLMPPYGERMRGYVAEMIAQADRTIDSWPVGKQFPIHAEMQRITLAVIMHSVFGSNDGSQIDRLRSALLKMLSITANPIWLVPLLRRDFGRLSLGGRILTARNEIRQSVSDLLNRSRNAERNGRTDVLSMLIDARDERGKSLSDEEIRDEIVTLLFAGHETTATALSWAFCRILQHPEVLRRIQVELAENGEGGTLPPEALDRLKYLDAAIKETLRLNPITLEVARWVSAPINIGGYRLPAGVVVHPSIYLAHRRSDLWIEPERFRPDRFLETKSSPYEYFPFGGGIRRCIGMSFALMEMKVVLARVLSRTDLRWANGYRPKIIRRNITLAPSKGVPVVMERRREL